MNVSSRVISRICRYRNVLNRFRQYGMKAVFSEELAQALGLTSAQVRKDFSIFKIPGKKKAGYRLDLLSRQFNRILEKTKIQQVVVLGAGPLGLAITQEPLLSEYGIAVAAIVDREEKIKSLPEQIEGIPLLPLARLIPLVRVQNLKYCILTEVGPYAQRLLDEAIVAGIRGVLNLSPFELKAPKACTLNAINLVAEIENMIYFTQQKLKSACSAS
jgi:redox-sensing transcriptional repressor